MHAKENGLLLDDLNIHIKQSTGTFDTLLELLAESSVERQSKRTKTESVCDLVKNRHNLPNKKLIFKPLNQVTIVLTEMFGLSNKAALMSTTAAPLSGH